MIGQSLDRTVTINPIVRLKMDHLRCFGIVEIGGRWISSFPIGHSGDGMYQNIFLLSFLFFSFSFFFSFPLSEACMVVNVHLSPLDHMPEKSFRGSIFHLYSNRLFRT